MFRQERALQKIDLTNLLSVTFNTDPTDFFAAREASCARQHETVAINFADKPTYNLIWTIFDKEVIDLSCSAINVIIKMFKVPKAKYFKTPLSTLKIHSFMLISFL